MTTNDFSHYALDSGFLYIYKTPDDASYTIGVIGTAKPDVISEDVSSDSTNLSQDADLIWGLVYNVLSKIAEINNAPQEADRYRILAETEKKNWFKRSEHKKHKLDRIQPYSLI